MDNGSGAPADAGQALVNQAPAGLGSSGFDPSRWIGDRYSPNLFKWLAKEGRRHAGTPKVHRSDDGMRWVGWVDWDGWFYGAPLGRVLCVGTRAQTFAYPSAPGVEDPAFWANYGAIGRCAIDEGHRTHFVGSENRWAQQGDFRVCLWCGNHTQRLRRWTETILRERWESASAIEAAVAGETANAGSTEGESAVPQADAQGPVA